LGRQNSVFDDVRQFIDYRFILVIHGSPPLSRESSLAHFDFRLAWYLEGMFSLDYSKTALGRIRERIASA
jgi:hypothetical protein